MLGKEKTVNRLLGIGSFDALAGHRCLGGKGLGCLGAGIFNKGF
jgi:hypothetical protein